MTISELASELDLEKLSGGDDREVASCYISDLLSRVLGGCSADDIWITVQTSLNMVAVAVMTEFYRTPYMNLLLDYHASVPVHNTRLLMPDTPDILSLMRMMRFVTYDRLVGSLYSGP